MAQGEEDAEEDEQKMQDGHKESETLLRTRTTGIHIVMTGFV